MTTDRDADAAREYHELTKHSRRGVRSGPMGLDFSNQPIPWKLYRGLESVALPEPERTGVPALRAVSSTGAAGGAAAMPDLPALASVLYYSAGVTKRRRLPDGSEMLFRAASCTGALYHVDLYVICGELPGLDAGVYHFDPRGFALGRLRAGDVRGELVRATGAEPSVAGAPAVIAYASTYWRNAWKYRGRTYRHSFWDTGTILSQTLAVCDARGLPARVVLGFEDGAIARLLGLDEEREATTALVALGRAPDMQPPAAPDMEPLRVETEPLSPHEYDYPAIREVQAASSLRGGEEAASWRGAPPERSLPAPAGRLVDLPSLPEDEWPDVSIERVIRRRGSTREFALDPIGVVELGTMLRCATGGMPADFLEGDGVALNDLYLIVNAVDGIEPGAYVYHRDRNALELLRAGEFRHDAGVLGLEQALPATAAANVYFLTDLDAVLERFGNRGYRAAQLEAAVVGGRLYLAAYALGRGATGLTFFDDEVTSFFSPHAEGKAVMFLTALGQPATGTNERR